MPLSQNRFPERTVLPWVRGLMPDSEAVRERWGTRFGVNPNNPFALLRHVGEDVAGAAQLSGRSV